MGIVIPFAPRAKADAPPPAHAPAREGSDAPAGAAQDAADRMVVLAAARILIDRCRDRYGFVVMRDGLPTDTATLAKALSELHRGLSMLDAELRLPRNYPTFGVYFGGRSLGWFEDGYSGSTGLSVPDDIEAATLAAFLRPRLTTPVRRSRE